MYNSSGVLSKERPDTRIAPDRKWFGNTRTITQEELSNFQNAYRAIEDDPFTVVLQRKKLPTSLVVDQEDEKKFSILKVEPFEETFGKKSKRNRPNIITTSLKTLVEEAEKNIESFSLNKKGNENSEDEEEIDLSHRHSVDMGQSKRVMGEVYKVIDSSDVIVEVLDARDPSGTRSRKIEEFMVKETPHKHLIFLLNKCDLIPKWAVERAVKTLSKERPTVAFRAHLRHSFGKDQLLGVLKQYEKLHADRAHFCVGFIGYPNVGKSSTVNTLRGDKTCPVAPIPGMTKVWQYITLTKHMYLIDCPGHVYPDDVTDVERVLRGVTRTERIEEPQHYVTYILQRIKRDYLKRHYHLEDWESDDDFLEKLAIRFGRLGKGGKADTYLAAKRIITDFQRGDIPWFITVEPKRGNYLKPVPNQIIAEQDDFSKLPQTHEFLDIAPPNDSLDEIPETESIQPTQEENVSTLSG